MLDCYLKRDDVSKLVKQIKTNERYFNKNSYEVSHNFFVSSELALYIFYDALLKYKIILDDAYLFDEYLEQLEKLYKKIDNFEDIRRGVNKLIGRMTSIKLGIKSVNSDLEHKQIVSYIYNKYILDGYFIHGFNTNYVKDLEDRDFIPEEYENYYEDFKEVNKIFEKYNVSNVIQKDFDDKKIYFTDDLVLGCYYSNYTPLFFYNFLTNKECFGKRIRSDAFLKDDYSICTRQLKRFMNDSFFNESDKNFVNELVKKQWDLLHKKDKKISLMLVRRKCINSNSNINLDEYIKDDSDLDEVIDRLLSSKCGSVPCSKKIAKEDITIVNLDGYYEKEDSIVEVSYEDEYYKYKEEDVSNEFMNVYGKASVFIILGSLFISLGVIISIFMIVRGM